MISFTDSAVCMSRAHCRACRTSSVFRESTQAPELCPHGYTADNLPSRGLGDTVAKITKRMGIKPCSGCKKRQKALNELVPYEIGV